MRKLTFLFALLCVSVMGWATQYCHSALINGEKTVYISCQLVSEGNYRLIVEGENLNGFGGSFFNPGAVDLRTTITSNTSTKIVCDIVAASAPNLYTPLYVMMPGEVSFTWPNDIEWAACGGSTPDPDPTPTPEPDPNSYTAGGHTITLDASYVDIDGTNKTYTLVISSTDDMQGLGGSFWNVNGVGADMRTNAGTSSYTVSGDKKTITCQVQSNSAPNIYTPLYVLMPGEVNFGNVTLNWEDRTPIASEYCGQAMSSDNTLAKFTWETTEEGNVNITIIEALGGASNATYFRGNGITADKIKIGESREAITTYFTHPGDIAGQSTLTLTLTDPANAPAPGTKIYVENQVIEYATSKDGNAWPKLSFEYTYGGVCAEEKVLTEISLNASAKFGLVGNGVTLTAQPLDQMGMPFEAAVDFEISPADAGAIVGNVFTFAKTGAATITAKSGEIQKSITLYGVPSANLALNQLSEGGYYDKNEAEGFDKANDGNNNTAWVTYADQAASVEWWYVDLGAVYSLTGINVLWGDPSSTSYKLFARTEAPSEDDKANDAAWEEIASVSGIGINSEQFNVVSVNARYVRVHSLTKSANFLRLKEVSVFGTEYVAVEDDEKPAMTSASLESAAFTEAVINVAATDNVGIYRFHVVDDANGIDANYAEADGKITITGLTHATNYNFTITAKDAAGNESDNNKVVAVSTPFDGSINLALNKPCEAGYEDGNPIEAAGKANDGNDGSAWVTYADRPASVEWWIVDLGQVYTLTNIKALWAGDYSTNYILQARVDAPTNEDKADDAAWVTLATVTDAAANAENSTAVSGVGRYVRFRSITRSANCIRLREFRVYGSGVAEVDAEKPVMSSASLVSNTDSHAVIAVAATDNQGIAKYHVVDAGNSFDANFAAEGGNITVTGLAGGTTYNFTITAIDFFGNESANSKPVEVTTVAHLTAPTAAVPAPTWPAEQVKALYSPTYEADYNHQDWGSGTTYTQEEYGKKYVTTPYDKGYFGADGFNLNCLQMEKLHYDIWIADDATIRIVPIWGGAEQGVTVNLIGQQWNSVDIPLSAYTGISDWSNIYQMKIDQAYSLTFWVGNAYFYRETAIVDNEAPVIVSASVTDESFNSVKITVNATDDSGAVNFIVKNGDAELATAAAASGVEKVITVNGLAAGTTYNFKVVAFDDAEHETESNVLTARTKFMPAPAPTPDFTGMTVVPVFTDAQAGGPETINLPDWGQVSASSFIDIASGDKVFFSQNFNYQGWGNFSIDATGMNYLHLDVYTNGISSLRITPISPEHEGISEHTLVANKWNAIDIPLTDYDGKDIDWSNIFQFKFFDATPAGKEIFIDNVYFYYIPEITFADDASNSDLIAENAGKVVAAEINRDILANDEWYTLCVPFDMDAAKVNEVFGPSTIATLVSSEDRGSLIHLNFDYVKAIEAGKPYLIKPTKSFNEGDIMRAVTIKNVAPIQVGDALMKFQGTYNPIPLNAENQRFVGPENYLYSPAEGGTEMGAFRCFFTIPAGSSAGAPGKRARIVFGEQVATGIGDVQSDNVQCTKVLQNGVLLIIRDGKTYNAQGILVK